MHCALKRLINKEGNDASNKDCSDTENRVKKIYGEKPEKWNTVCVKSNSIKRKKGKNL